ncbi:MAG TPA: AAA family ATPase [Rhodoferax sp.]
MFSHRDNNQKSDSSHDGYVACTVHFYRDQDIESLKLFLRSDKRTDELIKDLKEQAEAAQLQAIEERRSRELKALSKMPPEPVSATAPTRVFKKPEALSLDPFAERQILSQRRLTDSGFDELKQVPVYEWDEPLKLIEQKFSTPDSEVHKRNVELFKKLKAKGHLRRIAKPFDPEDCLSQLDLLRSSQPHFADVLDLVRRQIALAAARRQPLKLPPILLNGDPGVGKTFFTQALSTALRVPMRRHSFDSAVTESGLTGSDRTWANTSYGLVFEMVCLGDAANPIVLIDELDKASQTHNRNPIAPLHTLLEPITSDRVLDISVGLTFDASFVTWIATANNPSRIPAPIRSRFVEFDIQLPMGEHALKVARGVADSIHDEMGLPEFEPISPQIVKLIAHLVPREQGQVLRRAFASAIANQRTCLQRQDLPAEVLLSDDDGSEDRNADKPEFLH